MNCISSCNLLFSYTLNLHLCKAIYFIGIFLPSSSFPSTFNSTPLASTPPSRSQGHLPFSDSPPNHFQLSNSCIQWWYPASLISYTVDSVYLLNLTSVLCRNKIPMWPFLSLLKILWPFILRLVFKTVHYFMLGIPYCRGLHSETGKTKEIMKY
jgi:hypothetical protein